MLDLDFFILYVYIICFGTVQLEVQSVLLAYYFLHQLLNFRHYVQKKTVNFFCKGTVSNYFQLSGQGQRAK